MSLKLSGLEGSVPFTMVSGITDCVLFYFTDLTLDNFKIISGHSKRRGNLLKCKFLIWGCNSYDCVVFQVTKKFIVNLKCTRLIVKPINKCPNCFNLVFTKICVNICGLYYLKDCVIFLPYRFQWSNI